MTFAQAVAFIDDHGVVLESARHPVFANIADAFLGKARRGSWWGHPHGRQFFALTRLLRKHRDIVACRLIEGKVTYVHRRHWAALLRLRNVLSSDRIDVLHEVHTETGAHRVYFTSLERKVSPRTKTRAASLTVAEARDELGI